MRHDGMIGLVRIAMVCVAVAAMWAWAGARADDRTTPKGEEQWYAVMMQGQKAGHMVRREFARGGNLVETTEMRITLMRGDAPVKMGVESESEETREGRPVKMRTVMALAAAPVTTTYVFRDDDVLVISEMHGHKTEVEQEKPEGEWLPPLAAARKVAEELKAGKKEIVLRTVDASAGLRAITYTRKIVGPATVELLGKTVPAIKWESTVDVYPDLRETEYVNEKGESLKAELDFGMMKMEVIATEKELALADMDPPELMASTLVKAEGAEKLERARELRTARFELSLTEGRALVVPDTSVQRVQFENSRNWCELRVDLNDPAAASNEDIEDKAYREASTTIDFEHAEVQKLLAEFRNEHPGITAKVQGELLRKFVYEHINEKSLGVGFATASEAARTGEGDCSEHGVLLCALLRASGIPARVVSGIVYVDEFLGNEGVFGYHMWTQALMEVDGEKRWVDLDAALDPERAFDATHIALATSAMSDGEGINSMVTLAPMLGRLKVEVLEAGDGDARGARKPAGEKKRELQEAAP